MTNEELIKALRANRVETGSLMCLGCGYEHNCGIHGCAIMRHAADALEEKKAEAYRYQLLYRQAQKCASDMCRKNEQLAAEVEMLTRAVNKACDEMRRCMSHGHS